MERKDGERISGLSLESLVVWCESVVESVM